jgi:cell division GTPase FtsZ
MDLKLTDFPYSAPGYGRKVAVICIGSAGCKIGSQLSKESKLLEHFVYISCDDHDIASITKGERILIDLGTRAKTSPYELRGLVSEKLPQIRQLISDSDIVFVISGLGGTVGSSIAPVVLRECDQKGAVSVAIMVMPYNFEKSKHFFAGSALRQVRKYASGVIVIDNDELLQEDLPLIDAYALINQRISLALNKLLGAAEQHEFSIGLNNVVNFVNMNDLITSIGGLSGVLGSGTMQIEYGLSANSSQVPTAIIIATGFSTTKFDSYDPVDMALGPRAGNLDYDMEEAVDFTALLSNAELE